MVRFHLLRDTFFFTLSSDSLVVMTSALHAEGREFNPRSEHNIFYWQFVWFLCEKKKVEEQGIDPCASRMLSVRSTI